MRNLPRKAKPHVLNDPSSDKGPLLRAGTFSLLLHIGFLVIFSLSLKSTIARVEPSVYRVTIRPYAPLGAIQSAKPGGGPGGKPTYQTTGQTKLDKSPKGDQVEEMSKPDRKVEKVKKGEDSQSVKKQKLYERPARDEIGTGIKKASEKVEKPRKERRSTTSLQEAIDDIHRKVALDKIQQKVARREQVDDRKTKEKSGGRDAAEGQPPFDSLQNQMDSSSKTGSGPGVGAGAGTGSGSGIGSGAGGYPIGGVPWGSAQGSSAGSSIFNDYCDMIWAKIKKEWTLPENLPKGKTDLETIVVLVIEKDGKIQKSWFEKKSGNALYDQMAMRAIKKAEPLPPIPKEFSDDTFEIGIRFHPD